MSHFLTRIVQRTFGEVATVRPVAPPVTAPDAAAPAWDERVTAREAPLLVSAHHSLHRGRVDHPTPLAPEASFAAPPSTQRGEPTPRDPAAAGEIPSITWDESPESPPPRTASRSLSHASAEPAALAPRGALTPQATARGDTPARPQEPARLVTTARRGAPPAALAGDASEVAASPDRPAPTVLREPSAEATPPTAATLEPARSATTQRSVTAQAAVVRLASAPRVTDDSPRARAPQEREAPRVVEETTTVEVSIGRIEVRLPASARGHAPSSAAAQRRPAVDLAEYLRARETKGGR